MYNRLSLLLACMHAAQRSMHAWQHTTTSIVLQLAFVMLAITPFAYARACMLYMWNFFGQQFLDRSKHDVPQYYHTAYIAYCL